MRMTRPGGSKKDLVKSEQEEMINERNFDGGQEDKNGDKAEMNFT